MIEDLGSANGTFLNGQRVDRPMKVRLRDRIGFGNCLFQLTDDGKLEKRDYRPITGSVSPHVGRLRGTAKVNGSPIYYRPSPCFKRLLKGG